MTTKRNIPTSLAHLKGVHDRAVIVAAQHGRQLAAFNMTVDKRKADVQHRIELTDPKHREELGRVLEAEHVDWVKGYRKETADARWKDAKEITTLREDALAAKAILTNPLALATVHGFGTPERNAVAMEVTGLAPRAMQNLATMAVRTQNKVMAGALIVANDKLPRGDRAFSSQEIAAAVFGEEAEQAAKIIADIDRMHSQAVMAVRETEGQKPSLVDRVQYGLTHGSGRAVTPSPTVLARTKTPVSKISDGIASSHDFGG